MDIIDLHPDSKGVWVSMKPWWKRKAQSFEFWLYLGMVMFFIILPGTMDMLTIKGSNLAAGVGLVILVAATIVFHLWAYIRHPRGHS